MKISCKGILKFLLFVAVQLSFGAVLEDNTIDTVGETTDGRKLYQFQKGGKKT